MDTLRLDVAEGVGKTPLREVVGAAGPGLGLAAY